MTAAGVEIPSEQASRNFWQIESPRRTFVLSLLLALATIAVYLPVHRHPFFNVDDSLYISGNEHVRGGLSWDMVKWAFTAFDRSNWVPLSFVSHAIDYHFFGMDPAGHHDVNLLFQTLNALLLFWVLKRATGYVGRSFMVAALFALHPLNVEAVAWIAERKTLLSMLFFLLALGAYRWYASRPNVGRYVVVALLFALGLTAKAQVITLPCVLLLWDYWPLKRMFPPRQDSPEPGALPLETIPPRKLGWLILEKIPLIALSAIDALLTIYSEHDARPALWPPLTERLGNACYSYVQYLEKTFWPSAMAPFYPNLGNSLNKWQVGGAFLVLLAITAWVLTNRPRRYLLVGWFWFLGTLVPMLEIVQFGKEGMADRFAYQALIGVFLMVCWTVADWANRRQLSRTYLAAACAIVLLALAVVTHRQVGYWSDDLTLWQHATNTVKGHWEAEDNIGVALLRRGRPESEALPHFFRAAEMHPADPVSNMHIAVYEQQSGHLREAIASYAKVLPAFAPPQVKAEIYQRMGLAYTALGDQAKAQECFDNAVNLRTRGTTQ